MAVPGLAGVPRAGAKRRAFERALRGQVGHAAVDSPSPLRWVGRWAGGGLGSSGPVMCEDRGSYMRIGVYRLKEGQ